MSMKVYCGDVLEKLALIPDESIHCCISSPPYFGLRDYQTGTWDGGRDDCDHVAPPNGGTTKGSGLSGTGNRGGFSVDGQFKKTCGKCGAVRVDKQIGLESTLDEYVEKMVAVFKEVRRALRDDATCWINLGDSFCSTDKWGGGGGNTGKQTIEWTHADSNCLHDAEQDENSSFNSLCFRCKKCGGSGSIPSWAVRQKKNSIEGIKPKDLYGVPWRVAFALRDDGWWLRQDIIWSKPSPMPESVTSRCTKSHEYIFLLAKSQRYYFDSAAIAEPLADANAQRTTNHYDTAERYGSGNGGNGGLDGLASRMRTGDHVTRNKRSVWFTEDDEYNEFLAWKAEKQAAAMESPQPKSSVWKVATTPFKGSHFATFPVALITPCVLAGCPVGGVVLDPFAGSGTTLQVAKSHDRDSIGIELNPKYVELINARMQHAFGMFSDLEIVR